MTDEPTDAQAQATDEDAAELLRVAREPFDSSEADASGFSPEAADASVEYYEPEPAPEEQPATSVFRQLLELVGTLAVAFVLAIAIRTLVVEPFIIPTESMVPTIMKNDQVLVSKFVYRFRAPQRGDIVVLDDPTHATPALLKRVIAVGGQTVVIRDNKVWIDGVALVEPYTHDQPTLPGTIATPILIPKGYVWVMGDNRTMSKDSRYFGPQPDSALHGEAFMTYWPMGRIHILD